jgi:hypothetical protein
VHRAVQALEVCGGPVEGRSCVFVSPAWQVLGACTGRAEILQGCAGLGGWPAKQRSCRVEGTANQNRAPAGCAGLGGWHGLAEIVNVCGPLALRALPTEILRL